MPEPVPLSDPHGAPPPQRATASRWLLRPRASRSGGRLAIRYAGGVALAWIGIAVAGLAFGFATVGSDQPEPALAGLGLGAIGAFVAWFAANPVIVADRSGIAVRPLFGSRTSLRWAEVRAIEVREVRRARGRGPTLVIEATEDREAQVDGLWVGATRAALEQMASELDAFLAAEGIAAPRPVAEASALDPW